MTDTHTGFLDTILREPADDAVRLIYADWLQEQGDKVNVNRATFIRAQCEYAKLSSVCQKTLEPLSDGHEITDPKFYRSHCRCRVCAPRRRAYYAARSYIVWDWADELRALFRDPRVEALARGEVYFDDPPSWTWDRGFINTIMLPASLWLQNGHAIVRQQPIELVVISDKRPEQYTAAQGSFSWFALGFADDPATLPDDIFDILKGYKIGFGIGRACYDTETESVAALSSAALAWAREPLECEWRERDALEVAR